MNADWSTSTADAIERAVSTVRERTVEPVQTATRVAVYGLLAGCVILAAAFLLAVALFRLLVVAYQGEVWAAWLTLGAIFVTVGAFVWAKRSA